ncbi:MAG: SDR family oxidoreductase [Bacteroidales bacterium]|nr:SDR family oxidoreductase [Bacteroidales bacterium]
MSSPKVVLVTGGSSGIGAAIVKKLSLAGMKVWAGSRRGTLAENLPNAFPVVMDVTDSNSVKAAVKHILEKEGRIDAVVCNAGNGIAGAIEQTTVEEGKYQFETCFWGMHSTITEVLEPMRSQGYGKIITISSVAALVPIPFQAFYSAAKSSVLMYTKTLAMELKPFGIQCCSILPGDTKTGFTAARKFVEASKDSSSVYFEKTKESVGRMEKDEQNGMSPDTIADAVVRQLKKKKMAVTVTPRLDYKILVVLARILPNPLVLWILRLMYM